MKTSSSLLLALTLITPTALVFSTGCSKSNSDKVADAVQDAKVAVKDAATDIKDGAISTWNSIKDFTYDKRSDFAAGVDKATKSMDEKLAELKAKATADTPEKTKAREEYDEARAELKAKLNDLGNASADTWAAAKVEVSKAWDKVEASYDKLTK